MCVCVKILHVSAIRSSSVVSHICVNMQATKRLYILIYIMTDVRHLFSRIKTAIIRVSLVKVKSLEFGTLSDLLKF